MEFREFDCPYCGFEHDGRNYLEDDDEDGQFIMECESCKRKFRLFHTISREFVYETETIDKE